LNTVLITLYLLFSEGYYSESQDTVLRKDFCLEAMRLTYLLIENNLTNRAPVRALMSLMCFHASRFEARVSETGEMILYNDQDESLWDRELIKKGIYFLHEASVGKEISKYHLEAGIAYWHTIREDTPEKWDQILQLFNQLLQLQYSPVAALNRTYAIAKVKGKQAAISEAEKLNLKDNHFYYLLLGELYSGLDNSKAEQNLLNALSIAKTNSDKNSIRKKIDLLGIF